jgi:hypothetical protein
MRARSNRLLSAPGFATTESRAAIDVGRKSKMRFCRAITDDSKRFVPRSASVGAGVSHNIRSVT